jgi:hypothetical protein
MMPVTRTHQGVAALPAALAGEEVPVDAEARAVATVEGGVRRGVDRVVDVEVVDVVGVDVACCPADALVAVKVNLPLTGCPSREVARQSTVYLPAGESCCRRWVMMRSARTALPV